MASTSLSQSHIGQADDVARRAAVKAMRERGITNPEELAGFAEPAAILRACRWFDGRHDAGPGLLAKVVRDGGMRERLSERDSMLEREKRYGLEIVEWLRAEFPEWNKDEGNGTHPAAVAAVIRLHFKHGKGRLTKGEHGAVIRDAVCRFDAMLNEREGA